MSHKTMPTGYTRPIHAPGRNAMMDATGVMCDKCDKPIAFCVCKPGGDGEPSCTREQTLTDYLTQAAAMMDGLAQQLSRCAGMIRNTVEKNEKVKP